MNANKLGRMANQIASFFQAYPEAKAVAGIREHLVAYWTPKMRATFSDQIARDATGAHPLVVAAMRADKPLPESPTHRATDGPAEAGQLGASDAG